MSNNLKIKLVRSALSKEQADWITDQKLMGYPLVISATANENLENEADDSSSEYPANIFVLQLAGTNLDPNHGDTFNRVISVIDLEELPTSLTANAMNEANATLQSPFYRVSNISLFCESAEEVEQVWKFIQEDVKNFIDNYKAQYSLDIEETKEIS